MTQSTKSRPTHILIAAIIALLFGALTIFSGGSVLFSAEAARAAGNVVPFIVWFNFLAGFAYILAGIGLVLWRQWGVNLAMIIAMATLLASAGLGLYILQGGAFEMRTVIAMAFRFFLWAVIAMLADLAWKNSDRPA